MDTQLNWKIILIDVLKIDFINLISYLISKTSVIFEMFIFLKEETKVYIKTKKNFFSDFWGPIRQEFDLAPTYSIRDDKSGLRSLLFERVCFGFFFFCF